MIQRRRADPQGLWRAHKSKTVMAERWDRSSGIDFNEQIPTPRRDRTKQSQTSTKYH
jgi:hypothetical protein